MCMISIRRKQWPVLILYSSIKSVYKKGVILNKTIPESKSQFN